MAGKAIKVVIAARWGMGQGALAQLSAIPGVEVIDVSQWTETLLGARWGRQPESDPELRSRAAREIAGAMRQADVVYGASGPFSDGQSLLTIDPDLDPVQAARELFSNVRWVQLATTGVDARVVEALPGISATITSARGALGRPIAEWVVMLMLMLAKDASRLARQQAAKHWERFDASELEGATVTIIGFGAIGTEVARLARAFDMLVVAVRRDPSRGPHVLADEMCSEADLPRALERADFVVIAVPSNASTRKLIGAPELSRMKRSAYLVNVSRGGVVDEASLVAALREQRIAGAALDVFEREPLPADSPLWSLPNVVITPHMAGATSRHGDRIAQTFIDNLHRFLRGEPLTNVVDTFSEEDGCVSVTEVVHHG